MTTIPNDFNVIKWKEICVKNNFDSKNSFHDYSNDSFHETSFFLSFDKEKENLGLRNMFISHLHNMVNHAFQDLLLFTNRNDNQDAFNMTKIVHDNKKNKNIQM